VHVIGHPARCRLHFTAELDLVRTERPPPPRTADPAKVKAHQLPHRIKTETTGHHRVALEVATEEPQIGTHVELGDDLAATVLPTVVADVHDAVEHQHRRHRQLRVARPEQLPARASQQVGVAEGGDTLLGGGRFGHGRNPFEG
jgi:hypothetical protein